MRNRQSQMFLDHAAADTHAARDLFLREVVEPAQDEAFPAARRQFGDRLRQQCDPLLADELALRVRCKQSPLRRGQGPSLHARGNALCADDR